MYIVTNTKKVKGITYTSHVLTESYRENGKVKRKTLANLSALPLDVIETIKNQLKGNRAIFLKDELHPTEIGEGLSHGGVLAVMKAIKRLGLQELIGPPSKERDLVISMINNRILMPFSKLTSTKLWPTTTMLQFLNLENVDELDENELYKAMDWLLPRQEEIEKKLAERHLHQGDLVFYKLFSSCMEDKCALTAKFGYNRDKKRGKIHQYYSLLTDSRGCPIKIELFCENQQDTTTFEAMFEGVRKKYGLKRVIFVFDREILGSKDIEILKSMEDVDWITSLASVSIKSLVESNDTWRSPYDELNFMELQAPVSFPGERLIVCKNPSLAKDSLEKRRELLAQTEKNLEELKARVDSGLLSGKGPISLAVGRVIGKYRTEKYFLLSITDNEFIFQRDDAKIIAEEVLDGLYAIRTSLDKDFISSENCVRHYKELIKVEKAFRSIKTTDFRITPAHHHTEQRVRAHSLICMLARYVEWHLKKVWREITFDDEMLSNNETFDPTASNQNSDDNKEKIRAKMNSDGKRYSGFRKILSLLSTHVRTTERLQLIDDKFISYESTSKLTSFQKKALKLLENIATYPGKNNAKN